MARALLSPSAQMLILKPGGSFTASIGMSLAGVGAGGWAMGANGEFANSAGWPCFQGGGACWAPASQAPTTSRTNAVRAGKALVIHLMTSPFLQKHPR